MTFTVERLEFYLLIIVRISTVIATAPIFSLGNTPRKVKAGIAIALALVEIPMLEYTPLSYTGVVGYALLVTKEALTGALIGLASGLCMYIVDFSGHILDMEIGFSMVTLMDPTTRTQTSINGVFLNYLLILIMLATNLHYYIISTIYDSFTVIPIGGAVFNGNLYLFYLEYMVNYFVIGFRIILPIFASILIINVVLGVLAKVAPQMNMFAIGMQLKVFVGIFVLTIVLSMLPGISDFLFTQMRTMTNTMVEALAP